MLPHKHAVISATIGTIVWWKTGDPVNCVAALAAGTLPKSQEVKPQAITVRAKK